MPKSKRASSRNLRSRSRAEEWEKLGRELAEHKKAGEALRERAQALGRRDPNDPNDKPENDTYIRFDDLAKDAPVAVARPSLTVWWSQDEMTEWLILAMRIRDYFASEEKRTGQRVVKKEGVPYIMQCEPPPGKEMTSHIAQVLFTICRATLDGKGGRIPGRRNG